MIVDLRRALSQLADPRLWRIVLKAALAALVMLVALVAVLTTLVDILAATGIAWLDVLLPWLTGGGATIAAIFLLPITAASLLGLFVDEVAEVVEARWYPDVGQARTQGVVVGVGQALRLLGLTLALNLLALPFYLFLPGLNLVIFLALNGYLLGREYFETVAVRRVSGSEAASLRRLERGRVGVAGILIAALALIPGLNLLVPVLGTAFMVHLFHRLHSAPRHATSRRKT